MIKFGRFAVLGDALALFRKLQPPSRCRQRVHSGGAAEAGELVDVCGLGGTLDDEIGGHK